MCKDVDLRMVAVFWDVSPCGLVEFHRVSKVAAFSIVALVTFRMILKVKLLKQAGTAGSMFRASHVYEFTVA